MTAEEWFRLGIEHAQMKRWDQSLDAFGKAIELNPRFASAWANSGNVHFSVENLDAAIRTYEQALGLGLNKPWGIRLNLGVALGKRGRHDEAFVMPEQRAGHTRRTLCMTLFKDLSDFTYNVSKKCFQLNIIIAEISYNRFGLSR